MGNYVINFAGLGANRGRGGQDVVQIASAILKSRYRESRVATAPLTEVPGRRALVEQFTQGMAVFVPWKTESGWISGVVLKIDLKTCSAQVYAGGTRKWFALEMLDPTKN